MLEIKQLRQPALLDTALVEAIRAADAGDQPAALAALQAAQGPAAGLGYL
jgi:hypothetical protein